MIFSLDGPVLFHVMKSCSFQLCVKVMPVSHLWNQCYENCSIFAGMCVFRFSPYLSFESKIHLRNLGSAQAQA